MKAKIINKEGKDAGNVDLPSHFTEEVRSDLNQRAVLAIQSNKRQPYGNKPGAGGFHSADVSRRRRKYR